MPLLLRLSAASPVGGRCCASLQARRTPLLPEKSRKEAMSNTHFAQSWIRAGHKGSPDGLVALRLLTKFSARQA